MSILTKLREAYQAGCERLELESRLSVTINEFRDIRARREAKSRINELDITYKTKLNFLEKIAFDFGCGYEL